MKRDKGSPKVKRWILVTLAVFEKNECKFLRDNHRISGRVKREKKKRVFPHPNGRRWAKM